MMKMNYLVLVAALCMALIGCGGSGGSSSGGGTGGTVFTSTMVSGKVLTATPQGAPASASGVVTLSASGTYAGIDVGGVDSVQGTWSINGNGQLVLVSKNTSGAVLDTTTITITSGGGSTFAITVSSINNGAGPGTLVISNGTSLTQIAPAITSAASATFAAGIAGSFAVTATGTPTPAFSLTGALPAGITFNSSTGVLSGTPTGAVGSYPVTIMASNGVNPSATQNFALSVNPAFTHDMINGKNLTLATQGGSGTDTFIIETNTGGWTGTTVSGQTARGAWGATNGQLVLIYYTSSTTLAIEITSGTFPVYNVNVYKNSSTTVSNTATLTIF